MTRLVCISDTHLVHEHAAYPVPEGDVYVVGRDGTGLRQVTGDPAIDRVPRWSPDGNWLAFFSDRGGPADVWKIHVDGSDLTQLTDFTGGVPVWSPDGQRIVTSPAAAAGRARSGRGGSASGATRPTAAQSPVRCGGRAAP